jgi:HSP20 family protein
MLDRVFTMSRVLDDVSDATLEPVSRARGSVWFPALDSYETDNTFVISLDVPGVHPENVDISFEQNTLTIKGTRSATIRKPEKGELRVFTTERVAGDFARAIRLPEYVDGEKIEANYSNGVLTITIPKAAAAMPRKITVRTTEVK